MNRKDNPVDWSKLGLPPDLVAKATVVELRPKAAKAIKRSGELVRQVSAGMADSTCQCTGRRRRLSGGTAPDRTVLENGQKTLEAGKRGSIARRRESTK